MCKEEKKEGAKSWRTSTKSRKVKTLIMKKKSLLGILYFDNFTTTLYASKRRQIEES